MVLDINFLLPLSDILVTVLKISLTNLLLYNDILFCISSTPFWRLVRRRHDTLIFCCCFHRRRHSQNNINQSNINKDSSDSLYDKSIRQIICICLMCCLNLRHRHTFIAFILPRQDLCETVVLWTTRLINELFNLKYRTVLCVGSHALKQLRFGSHTSLMVCFGR